MRRLLCGGSASGSREVPGEEGDAVPAAPAAVAQASRRYDVDALYDRFRQEDPGVCRQYLLSRGIDAALVEELIRDGTVVHNRHEGHSFCTFAVRDEAGRLRCLDNHAIGEGKFVLGGKIPFSREWAELRRAKVVFLTEGIIDYLSLKTLESKPPPGLALLGNRLMFEPCAAGGGRRAGLRV